MPDQKPKRKQISKSVRFEVFKRDTFTCQYCGSTPPKAILHVDHITPVALGGKNNLDNLLTACSECNLGKAARPLSSAHPALSLAEKAKQIKEREAQIKEYNKILAEEAERIECDVWNVIRVLENGIEPDSYNRENFQSIKKFVQMLPLPMVSDAAEIAVTKFPYKGQKQFKYFCGVCWSMVRENQHA